MFRHVTNAENRGASCPCFFHSSWLRRIVDGKPWYPLTEFSTVYITYRRRYAFRVSNVFTVVRKIRSTSCRRASNRSRDQTEGTRNRQIHIILLDHRIIILKTQCYRDKLRPVNNGFNKAIRFDNGIDRACARYALLSTFRWHTMIRTCIDAYCFYLCSPDTATFATRATCRIYSQLLLEGRELIIFHAIDSHLYWLLEKDEIR